MIDQKQHNPPVERIVSPVDDGVTRGICSPLVCRNQGQEPHYCPYQSNVNNDHETKCNCCPSCTQGCIDAI